MLELSHRKDFDALVKRNTWQLKPLNPHMHSIRYNMTFRKRLVKIENKYVFKKLRCFDAYHFILRRSMSLDIARTDPS